ncbi:MAG TPA: ribose-phosphate pyrophosphokinase [Candidatus Saccharimonadales bacterium]|nr:ribose-phosphate pyrophosphokinase [Candidatus Saccharimonadales bacterium]
MNTVARKDLKIITGNQHPMLARAIARRLGVPVTPVELTHFANGEIKCQILESVRGADVFIVQTHSKPVNDAVMEQAILIDAARRASAKHITAVCPFFGYARQDRKASGREPITAKLVVDILRVAGVDRIVTVDLHSGQIQGFFDGPFDHLIAMPVLIDHLQKRLGSSCVIVSPDAGRVKLAERYVSRLGAEMAILHKRRAAHSNAAEAPHLIGEVKGRNCVVIDDMIDGGGTVCAAAEQLTRHQAASITVIATHGIFSEPAAQRLAVSPIDYLAITDTLPLSIELEKPKIVVVSVVDLLADSIAAIFQDRSVSALFDDENQS